MNSTDCVITEKMAPKEQKLELKHVKDKFQKLRREANPYFKLLGYKPTSELEAILSNEDELPAHLDDGSVKEAEGIIGKLKKQLLKNREEFNAEWEIALEYLKDLKDSENVDFQYSVSHPNMIQSLKNFTAEMFRRQEERCYELKILKASILDVREQLNSVWAECHISDAEREYFVDDYKSENFTRHLYERHLEELQTWKEYQAKNRKLMEKVTRRQQMWEEMVELENRSEDPGRFVNRGATLLKDANALNQIRKQLPKVEDELKKLSERFAMEHGRPLTIYGKEIPQIIKDDWEKFNEMKAKRKFTRTNNNIKSTLVQSNELNTGDVPAVPTIAQATPRKRLATSSQIPSATPSKRRFPSGCN